MTDKPSRAEEARAFGFETRPLPGVQLARLEPERAVFLGPGRFVGHEGLFLDFLDVIRCSRFPPGSDG